MSRITKQVVQKLVTGRPFARIVWDEELKGFGARQTEAGTVTFVLDYYFKGKKRRYCIGRHPEFSAEAARKEAMSLKVDIADGHDPVAERHEWKSEPKFMELAAAYLKDAKTRKRDSSLYDDRRMLGVNEDGTPKDDEDEAQRKKRILAVLGEQRLAEIKQSDIARFHESLRETPYQANRVLALLSSIFNYGIAHKWIESNPAKGIKKFDEAKRERWLTVEELQKFREALDKYKDQSAADVLRLLLLTGSRASEALKACWEEFDLQRGVWTKPSHHTKQKKVEHVPLSAPALKLLESMAPENPAGPLFPGRARKGRSRAARVSLKRPWIAACRAAGLVEEYLIDGKRTGKDGEPVKLRRYRPTVRVHDLRHNFASHLASNGVSLQVVGKLLGHTQAATTMRYAHLQDAPLRDAANQFGRIFEQTPKVRKRS
ncbi:MAG: tyrosine-type recombinase/integrase [Terracidiphilus sp.]